MKASLTLNPFNNAEFIRHVWTDFSAMRLIIAPLLIVAIALAFYSVGMADKPNGFAEMLYLITLCVALLSHMTLSIRAAGAALREEVTDNTWDFQRMSPLTSGELSFGKLYGVTSYHSYCTAIALIINIICVQFLPDIPRPLWYYMTFIAPISIILCGFFGQSLTFLLSAYTFMLKRKNVTSGSDVLGFLAAGMLLYHFTAIGLGNIGQKNFVKYDVADASLLWHGFNFDTIQFMIASIAFFLLSTHTAIYRFMRTEMQYKNMPFVWIGFCLVWLVYLTGMPETLSSITGFDAPQAATITQKLLFALFMMLPVIYLGAFSWSGHIAGYTRFFTALRNKDTRTALTTVPPWFINVSIAVALLLTAIISNQFQGISDFSSTLIFVVGLMMLLFRDIIIFHAFAMPGVTRHVGFLQALYIACMYLLFPLMTRNKSAFFPSFNNDIIGLLPMVGQFVFALGVLFLCYAKAKRHALAEQAKDEASV